MNKFQKLINHPSEIELYMTVCADVLCMMTVYVFSGFFNSSKNILNWLCTQLPLGILLCLVRYAFVQARIYVMLFAAVHQFCGVKQHSL